LNKSESPFPIDDAYQIWLKSIKQFWRRSKLKGKLAAGWTPDAAPSHNLSSHGFHPGELIIYN